MPARLSSPNFIKNESLVTKVDCQNVIKVYECFTGNGTAYMSMEFLEGVPLDKCLHSISNNYSEIALLTLHVLLALNAIHNEEIFHRDIKPENIFRRNDGSYVLFDFGAARIIRSNSGKNPTKVLTAEYCSPEQETSDYQIGAWSDIYSLGVVLYKCITGKLPTRAVVRYVKDSTESLAQNYSHIYPRFFLEAIDIALSVEPTQRFQNAQQWLDYLNKGQQLPGQQLSYQTKQQSVSYPTQHSNRYVENNTYQQTDDRLASNYQRPVEDYSNVQTNPKDETYKKILFLLITSFITLGLAVYNIKTLFVSIPVGILAYIAFFRRKKVINKIHFDAIDDNNQTYSFDVKINKEVIKVGRGESVDVDLYKCLTVSRLHCELIVKDGHLYIRDLGSSNGTFVRGERLSSNQYCEIFNNDKIAIGKLKANVKIL